MFSQKILEELDAPFLDRMDVYEHLQGTTWPSFFLSIENARQTLENTSRPWPPEDDNVLMSLSEVFSLSEDAIDSAFFPHRLPQECKDRRKFLKETDYVINKNSPWVPSRCMEPVANGREIFQALCDARELLIARRTALMSLKQYGNTKSSKGHQAVSMNTLLHGRKALDFTGWPGRFRDLQSFKDIPEQATAAPSDEDADSLHVLLSSCSNGISWNAIKAAFYPAVSEADWKDMTRSVALRRKWSQEELDELMEATEKDELDDFAARHGRFVGEVELKSQRKFEKQPNISRDQSDSPLDPLTKTNSRYKVTKRVRRDRTQTVETAASPPKKRIKMESSTGAPSPLPTDPTESSEMVQSIQIQPGTNIRESADITEDSMFEVLHYYVSDAYNIVRLRSDGVSFETISKLKLKGTYNIRHIRSIYDKVSETWKDFILASPWWEFEQNFKEVFEEVYITTSNADPSKLSRHPQRDTESSANTGQSGNSSNTPTVRTTLRDPARGHQRLTRGTQTATLNTSKPSQVNGPRQIAPDILHQSQQRSIWPSSTTFAMPPPPTLQQGMGSFSPFQAYPLHQSWLQPFQPPAQNYSSHTGHESGANVFARNHPGMSGWLPLRMYRQYEQNPGQSQVQHQMPAPSRGIPDSFHRDPTVDERSSEQSQSIGNDVEQREVSPNPAMLESHSEHDWLADVANNHSDTRTKKKKNTAE